MPRQARQKAQDGRKVKEKDALRTIMHFLDVHRIFHWRNNSGTSVREYKGKRHYIRFGTLGAPDIFALHGGHIYGIEVKGSDGFQSQHQVEFQHEFEKAGGVYILARSIEDIKI
jgi:hypothetical protein